MIRSYTHREIGYLSNGNNFLLPILHAELSDEEVIKHTIEWFSNTNICYAEYTSIEERHPGELEIKMYYHGYDEYYHFSVIITFIRFRHDVNDKRTNTIPDGCPVIACRFEHAYGGLMDELLDTKVLPELIKRKQMSRYYDHVKVL